MVSRKISVGPRVAGDSYLRTANPEGPTRDEAVPRRDTGRRRPDHLRLLGRLRRGAPADPHGHRHRAASTPAAGPTTQPASGTSSASACRAGHRSGRLPVPVPDRLDRADPGHRGRGRHRPRLQEPRQRAMYAVRLPRRRPGSWTPVTDIGLPSTENHSTARELITLQPGGFANATLQIVDAGNFSASVCMPVKATGSPSSRRTRPSPCTSTTARPPARDRRRCSASPRFGQATAADPRLPCTASPRRGPAAGRPAGAACPAGSACSRRCRVAGTAARAARPPSAVRQPGAFGWRQVKRRGEQVVAQPGAQPGRDVLDEHRELKGAVTEPESSKSTMGARSPSQRKFARLASPWPNTGWRPAGSPVTVTAQVSRSTPAAWAAWTSGSSPGSGPALPGR